MDILIQKNNEVKTQVFPKNFIKNITNDDGVSLESILDWNNSMYLTYVTDVPTTLKQVPLSLRRKGLMVTFIQDTVVRAYSYNADDIQDTAFTNISNWILLFSSINAETATELRAEIYKYIDDTKLTIDSYTVNNHNISSNPVLVPNDLVIQEGYNSDNIDDTTIHDGDGLSLAIGKLEKKGNNLSNQINSLNTAYAFVASIDSIDKLRSYPVDTNRDIRQGSVFNITAAFSLNSQTYPAGTNIAINGNVAKGTQISDNYMDPLGGIFDNDAVNASINVVKKVVWNNHASAWINANPNPIEKGVDTNVTVSWGGNLSGFDNPNIIYVVKKNGSQWTTDGTSKQEAINSNATYSVDATIEGTLKSASVTVNAYYPVYTFTSTNDTITTFDPSTATKQPITNTPVGKTYGYTVADSAKYLYIAMPDSMSITDATSSGYSVGMVSAGTVAVDGKGNYKLYRTNLKQSVGSYSLLFK